MILLIVSFFRRRAVDVVEMRDDLAGGQTFRRQRQDDLVDPRQTPLAFLDDLWIEGGVGVPRDLDLHGADLGQHGLAAPAVAGVSVVSPFYLVFLVSEVLVHFRFEGGFEHRGGELVE